MSEYDQAASDANDGIGRAVRGCDPMWLALCRVWIMRLPAGREFTGNDVLKALGRPSYGSARALGGIVRELERDGSIEKTGRYTPSPNQHLQPIRVWRRVAALQSSFGS